MLDSIDDSFQAEYLYKNYREHPNYNENGKLN